MSTTRTVPSTALAPYYFPVHCPAPLLGGATGGGGGGGGGAAGGAAHFASKYHCAPREENLWPAVYIRTYKHRVKLEKNIRIKKKFLREIDRNFGTVSVHFRYTSAS